MPTMQALRVQAYGGPEQLRVENVPVPAPNAQQILVRVHAASINPFDLKLASGDFQKMIPLTPPYIPGGDFSGVVESADSPHLKPGDAVYGNCPRGAHAQFVAVPLATVAPKPANLSHAQAASVPVGAQTAWQALFDHGHLEPGQTVLIHAAAGGVGSFAVQLARWKGARVLATASAANAAYLRSLGAAEVIDYKTTPFESVAKNVDLVLDLLGGDTQTRSFTVLRPGGYLVSTVQPPSQELANKTQTHAAMIQMNASAALLATLASLLDHGTLKTAVTESLPLARAAEAWTQSQSGHTRGKIILEMPI